MSGIVSFNSRLPIPQYCDSQARVDDQIDVAWCRYGIALDRWHIGNLQPPRPESDQEVRRRLLLERSRCMNGTGWNVSPWLKSPP